MLNPMNPIAAAGAITEVAAHRPPGTAQASIAPGELLSDPMVLKALGAAALYVWGGQENQTARTAAMVLAGWAVWDYLHRPKTTVQVVVGPDGRAQRQTILQPPVLGSSGPVPGAVRAEYSRQVQDAYNTRTAQYRAEGAIETSKTIPNDPTGQTLSGTRTVWGWRWPDGRWEEDSTLTLQKSLFGQPSLALVR